MLNGLLKDGSSQSQGSFQNLIGLDYKYQKNTKFKVLASVIPKIEIYRAPTKLVPMPLNEMRHHNAACLH